MPALKTYDIKAQSITIGGALITNFNSFRFVPDAPDWIPSASNTGHQTHAKNANKGGKYILALPQTSGDNDIMAAFEALDTTLLCSYVTQLGRLGL